MEALIKEADQLLGKTKIQMMVKPDTAFFTTVCLSLKFEWDDAIPTACVDGRTMKLNPTFFVGLSKEEKLFLLLHETLHVAFQHMVRLNERDMGLWNQAADYVINDFLIEKDFSMPRGGLHDRKYPHTLGTEEVYNRLKQDPNNKPMEEDLLDLVPAGSEEEDEALGKEIQDILIQANIQSKMRNDSIGSIPGDIERLLESFLKPKLPWYTILRRYVTGIIKEDYSFKRPNRRYMPDYIIPSQYSEALTEVAVAVDVSGSVTQDQFHEFLTETHSIIKSIRPKKTTLIQFDTRITNESVLISPKDLGRVEFIGGGGTDIQPVMDWAIKNNPSVLIVFTDGEFYQPTRYPSSKILWIIHSNNSFEAEKGRVILFDLD